MGQDLKVTTLICNYNNVEFIHRAITSAKNQTYPTSICVVDDGSTDRSKDVILDSLFGDIFPTKITENGYTKYKHGPNIFIQLSKNSGPSFARNVGIQQTLQGTDVYAILDADDEMYPNKVEACIKEFEDQAVGVVYADYDILDMDSNLLRLEYKERFSKSRLMRECIVHSGSLIRAAYLDKVREPSGWYDISLRCAEDFDLWLRMSDISLISHVPRPLTLVRVHKDNSTNSVQKQVWQQCWQRVSEKLHARNNQKKQARV